MSEGRPDGGVRHFVQGGGGQRAGAPRAERVGQDDAAADYRGVFAAVGGGDPCCARVKTPSPQPSPRSLALASEHLSVAASAGGCGWERESGCGPPCKGRRQFGRALSPRGERQSEGDSSEGAYHYIGHANGIKPRLSVIENVSFWQRYYSGGEDIEAAEDALEAFALLNLASFSAGHLSQGQARRLGLARLMAARRPVWLLDEPQAALDAASTRLLESTIAAHLSSGGLAIVSTHLDLALPDAQVLELGAPGVVE